MKILLLGKNGQVGWEMQRSLAPHGTVVAYGREECDLADLDQVRQVVRQVAPQVIVNAAAYTAVDRAEQEMETARRINGEAPGLLAEEAGRLGSLLVHYSTDYVFDGELYRPYVETDGTRPQSVYGHTKLEGEEAILRTGCRALIFRTSWVFGIQGGNFVKTILRLAQEKESINVVDDQVGSPTPAALIATVTGLALARARQERSVGEGDKRLYHLTAARPVSWCQFARTIVGQAGGLSGFDLRLVPETIRAIPSSDYPTPARRPGNSRLDCSRLERDFDLRMPDWQPYLERMLQLLARLRKGD